MKSWRLTTEYLASMDFVVTADTACLHLCGLLGVPTLAFIPLCADWKWCQGQHLYGPALKVFRNTTFDWDIPSLLAAIRKEIA